MNSVVGVNIATHIISVSSDNLTIIGYRCPLQLMDNLPDSSHKNRNRELVWDGGLVFVVANSKVICSSRQ